MKNWVELTSSGSQFSLFVFSTCLFLYDNNMLFNAELFEKIVAKKLCEEYGL